MSITKKYEMYWATRSEVYNNIRQQPGEVIHAPSQRIKAMTAKCVCTEEEEIILHSITYYEVRVKLHTLGDKDIDFERIITEGIRYEL